MFVCVFCVVLVWFGVVWLLCFVCCGLDWSCFVFVWFVVVRVCVVLVLCVFVIVVSFLHVIVCVVCVWRGACCVVLFCIGYVLLRFGLRFGLCWCCVGLCVLAVRLLVWVVGMGVVWFGLVSDDCVFGLVCFGLVCLFCGALFWSVGCCVVVVGFGYVSLLCLLL